MALWGSKDSVSKVGTVTVDYANKTVTGVGTDFVASGVAAGNVITFGANAAEGQAVISDVLDPITLAIGSTAALSGNLILSASYNISESPIYAVTDSNYSAGEIYGIDISEVGVAATTPYAVTHAGWVGMTTYIDNHGNLRVKHEVLVAGSNIINDANDDAKFPDTTINILTDVVDAVGVATDGIAEFSVIVSANPTYAPLIYQWYEGATALTDGGDYIGATTSVLYVANDSDKNDGREYSVVIASGDTSVTSGVGTITYA